MPHLSKQKYNIFLSYKDLLFFQTSHWANIIGFHIVSNFSQTIQPSLNSFGTLVFRIVDYERNVFSKKYFKTRKSKKC